MWARVAEFMLACWLAMSPFIFRHPADHWPLWASDFVCAMAVAALSLLSYWQPTRWAHLGNLAVALWLVGFGRLSQSPPLLPGLQNDILVGLTLLMLALVPNEAAQPPPAWRERLTARRSENMR